MTNCLIDIMTFVMHFLQIQVAFLLEMDAFLLNCLVKGW